MIKPWFSDQSSTTIRSGLPEIVTHECHQAPIYSYTFSILVDLKMFLSRNYCFIEALYCSAFEQFLVDCSYEMLRQDPTIVSCLMLGVADPAS